MSLRSFIKKSILTFFDIVGLNAFLRKHSKTPIVLFWHGVSVHPDIIVEGESFPADLFERQVKYLVRYYEVISMDEFYKRFTNNCFTNKEVVITFDDGLKNNLTVAAPILKKYRLPFTVFVSALNIEEQKRFYITIPRLIIIGAELSEVEIPLMDYKRKINSLQERIMCAREIEYEIKYYSHEKAKLIAAELIEYIGGTKYEELCSKYSNGDLLTWNNVKELTEHYECTIGSHCLDHCICHSAQDAIVIEEQLVKSKSLIEDKIGIPCDYFAYPNGNFTDESNDIVLKNYKMGFSTLVNTIYSKNTNISCVWRMGVPCDMLEFKFFLSKINLSS